MILLSGIPDDLTRLRVVQVAGSRWDGGMPVLIDGGSLTREQVVAVARDGVGVELTEAAMEAVGKARAHIEELAHAETPTYGVSTGFGALATKHIPPERRVALQQSIVRSH